MNRGGFRVPGLAQQPQSVWRNSFSGQRAEVEDGGGISPPELDKSEDVACSSAEDVESDDSCGPAESILGKIEGFADRSGWLVC